MVVILATVGFRSALLREALHGIGWHRSAVVGELWASALTLAVCVTAFVAGRLTLVLAFAAIVSGALTQWLFQSWSIRHAYRVEPATAVGTDVPSLVLLKRMVVFSLPGLTAGLGMAFAGRMDRLLLAFFHDTAAVGVYATASTLADLPWVLPLSASAIIVRSVAQSQSTVVHRGWWVRVMAATLALCMLTLVGGWWLLERFLGHDFQGTAPVLGILLIGSLALASLQVDLAVCSGLGDLGASARSATWGAGIGLVAYFALIPRYGAVGCAIGSAITYLSMAVVARVRLRRHAHAAKGGI
jgi:O-antigen/teichoic acid export membrane protein